MDPYFKDYKDQEGKKVVTVLHASTAVATTVLYKLGADPNSAFFVIALVANATAYGYWYLADAAVYHEAAALHAIEQKHPQSDFFRELLSRLIPLQQRGQMLCFVSAILAWAAIISGLTAAFVLNIGLLPGCAGGSVILISMVFAVGFAVVDLRKHMKVVSAERTGVFP
jgi:hypothetical protein